MALPGAGGFLGGLSGALGGIQNQIMSQLPAAGLIGLVLYGRTRELRFEAQAADVGRLFDKVGGLARTNITSVKGQLETLYTQLGSTGEEVRATAGKFAEFGLANEVFKRAQISVERFGGSIAATAIATDQLYDRVAGATAGEIGQVYLDTGLAADAAADAVGRIGIVADKTNSSLERLSSTLIAGVQTLRMQRQGTDDLAAAYLRVRAGVQASAFGRGLNEDAQNEIAMRGVAAVAGGLSGLSDGIKFTIAEAMMGARTGMSDLDKLVAFEEGTASPEGRFLGSAMAALKDLVKEQGGRSDQIRAGMAIAPGLGFEGWRAVVDAQPDALAEALKTPNDKLIDAMNEQSARLMQGLDRAVEAQDPFQRAMRQLLEKIADASSGIFDVVVGGVASLLYLPVVIKDAMGRSLSKEEEGELKEARLLGVITQRGYESIFDAVLGAKGVAGDHSSNLMPDTAEWKEFKRLRAERGAFLSSVGGAEERAPREVVQRAAFDVWNSITGRETDPARIEQDRAWEKAKTEMAAARVQRLAGGLYDTVGNKGALSERERVDLRNVMAEEASTLSGGRFGSEDDEFLLRRLTEAVMRRVRYLVDADDSLFDVKLSVQKTGSSTITQSPIQGP